MSFDQTPIGNKEIKTTGQAFCLIFNNSERKGVKYALE
jgi:hypothetical protein